MTAYFFKISFCMDENVPEIYRWDIKTRGEFIFYSPSNGIMELGQTYVISVVGLPCRISGI